MKRNVIYPRQDSLVSPIVHNPFVHELEWTPLEYLKIAIMSVTIAPIRLLLVGVSLILAWVLAVIAIGFRSEAERVKPMTGWRKALRQPILLIGRTIYFIVGFQSIKVKGQPAPASASKAALMCVAPHSSFFDAIVYFMSNNQLASPVSKKENDNILMVGTLMQFTQPVYVKREDPDSRVNTIKEISRRAQSNGEWPQVIIFPEGTCTNRTCLITFKPGAFYPGQPIQPVCIRYPNKFDTMTWTWEGPGAFTLFWLTLCQFHNYVEIEYLPVYYPSEAEKLDARLYANNVRNVMAKCLECPITDHTYDDCRLMMKAARLNLPMASGLVEFQKLHKKLRLSLDEMQLQLDKFHSITSNKSGCITIEEFASYLHLPVSPALQEMFNIYDRNNSGTIDFREYIIGLSLVSGPVNTEDTLKLAFQLFDSENNGYITQQGFLTILHNAFKMDADEVETLFLLVDKDDDGKITFDEFQLCAMEKPEYAKLFVTYQNIQNENGHAEHNTQEEMQKAKSN